MLGRNKSLKKVLKDYFGADTVDSMRKPYEKIFGPEQRKHLVPLRWQYADQETLGLLLEHRFLLETRIEDDHIAYIYQQGRDKCVFLMFMLPEENAPFSMDAGYAKQLVKKWQADGYRAKILSQTVGVEDYPNSKNFRLVQHSNDGKGAFVYNLTEHNGRPVLVFDAHECWEIFDRKVVGLSGKQDLREYECLFEPDVALTTGDEENRKTVAKGIEAIAEFLRTNMPVRICLAEYRNSGIYQRLLVAGDKKVSIWINARNLISQVDFSARETGKMLDCANEDCPESLLAQVPELLSVRALDTVQMHGYAVQAAYADGSLRNYYLKTFETPQIPEHTDIDGFLFDVKVLHGVTVQNNGICFPNGYAVAAHRLFYRSYRQVVSSPGESAVPGTGELEFESIYRLPLKEFKNHFSVRHYWGEHGECYGPADALLDSKGHRISDISFYGSSYGSIWDACVEPTGRYGILRKDGTWLAPPVYCKADTSNGLAEATRMVDGEKKNFLIAEDGREIPFDGRIKQRYMGDVLCPFNAAKEAVHAPNPGYYWEEDYDVHPGKWGFVDMDGNVVVEPQYVYAVGFYNGGSERSVVAKLVDGKLLWGAVDESGREVIACRYKDLYTRWGDAYAFRREEDTAYGVMDKDGNVLAEPQFAYFEAYDEKHGLLTVGQHSDALGVYSLKQQKMMLPEEYDCIDYGENFISCEIAYDWKERYFGYDGKELDYSAYDRVSEQKDGMLLVWKDRRCGYIRLDGTVLIPPILHSWEHRELYGRGYLITGDKGSYGLATLDGRQILPEKYSEITAYDDFIIASKRTDANWSICDGIYSYKGTLLLPGPYRRMHYKAETGVLIAETPLGTEYIKVHRKK